MERVGKIECEKRGNGICGHEEWSTLFFLHSWCNMKPTISLNKLNKSVKNKFPKLTWPNGFRSRFFFSFCFSVGFLVFFFCAHDLASFLFLWGTPMQLLGLDWLDWIVYLFIYFPLLVSLLKICFFFFSPLSPPAPVEMLLSQPPGPHRNPFSPWASPWSLLMII